MDATTVSPELAAALAVNGNTPKRHDNLRAAAALGADGPTLLRLAQAARLSRETEIVLPEGRYSHTSRAKGWARKGSHASAVWGEREAGGFRVGPGFWVVCSSDGFNRESKVSWTVANVQVGGQTWTIAD